MELDDPGNLERRLYRQIELLEKQVDNGTISTADSQAILEFLNHIQANRDNTSQTNANHVKLLRLTSQRTDNKIIKFEKSDLDAFTIKLQHDYDISNKTLNNYKGSWKPFYRHLGKSWANSIEFYDIDNGDVEPWRVYSDNEIDEMLMEADGRTTCAIAILADTGLRITMLLSIPVGNKDFTGDVPVLKLNKNAPTKGGKGNIPLTFSRRYVENYLMGDHPRPTDKDVALIHKHEQYTKESDGALSPKSLGQDIKEVMKSVGIKKKRRQVHNFRHTAVTNWLRMNMPEQILQHRTKWSDMSMKEHYSHLVEEDKDKMTAEFFGLISTGDSDRESEPKDIIGECPTCTTKIRPSVRYCPGCGTPVDAVAAHDTAPNELMDSQELAEELSSFDEVLDEMGVGAVIEELLRTNPELLDDLDLE